MWGELNIIVLELLDAIRQMINQTTTSSDPLGSFDGVVLSCDEGTRRTGAGEIVSVFGDDALNSVLAPIELDR